MYPVGRKMHLMENSLKSKLKSRIVKSEQQIEKNKMRKNKMTGKWEAMGQRGLPEINLQRIEEGKEEIIIRYRAMTPELSEFIRRFSEETASVIGKYKDRQYKMMPSEIYYFESVDEKPH